MRRRPLLLGVGGMALGRPVFAAEEAARPVIEWPVIELLDGRQWSPASWREQPAVVVVWATWCGFCHRHNAHIDRLYRVTQEQGLRVLGIAVDGDAAAVREHLSRHRLAFPVAMNAGRLREKLSPRRLTPLTALLDRQGRLLQLIPGEMSEDDVIGLAARLRASER